MSNVRSPELGWLLGGSLLGTGLNLFFSSFLLEEPGFCFHRKLYDQGRLSFLHSYEGLPYWLSGRESACKAGAVGDAGLVSGLG